METCNVENKKGNRKQVCFSDKELEMFGDFIDSKGKFSTYVKKLIEKDFNSSQPTNVDLSSLETKLDELRDYLTQQIKEVKQAPITIQMQNVPVPQQSVVVAEPKTEPKAEPKVESKTEVNKEQVKATAQSFNRFRNKQ